MAFSSALWEVISGNFPGGQNWNSTPATPSGYTKEGNPIFGGIFVGSKNYNYYKPRPKNYFTQTPNLSDKKQMGFYGNNTGTGGSGLTNVTTPPPPKPENSPPKPDLSTYVPPSIATNKTPKQEITESDIDNMLMKVHHLSMDKFPNETRWALARAKRKLQQLKPNERAFLRDPYIPAEQKKQFLTAITALTSPEELQERWMRRQLDLAIRLGKSTKQHNRRHFAMRPFEEGMFSPYNTEAPGIEQARGYSQDEDLYTASPII